MSAISIGFDSQVVLYNLKKREQDAYAQKNFPITLKAKNTADIPDRIRADRKSGSRMKSFVIRIGPEKPDHAELGKDVERLNTASLPISVIRTPTCYPCHLPQNGQGGGIDATLFQHRGDANRHLNEISRHVAPKAHGVVLMDRAGWHTTGKLNTPKNITIILLPSRAPELNLKTSGNTYAVTGSQTGCLTITKPSSMRDAKLGTSSWPNLKPLNQSECVIGRM